MAYELRKRDAGPLAEREWGIRKTVSVTAVTSCIVLVAPVGSKLFGVHLSMFDATGTPFSAEAAQTVATLMGTNGADTNNVQVFGEIGFWPPGFFGLDGLLTIKGEHQKSGVFDVSPDMVGIASGGGCCVVM